VRTLGDRAIDPQTPVGRALTRWRSELLGDLGGPESVSTQQLAIVDVAVRTKLILDSVDAWLLAQPTLVHHRTRSLWPVVWQRQRIADGFTRALLGLGLERRTKGVDLARVLAEPHPRESDDRLELERAVSSTNTDDRLDVDDESDDRSSTSARSTDPA
jgi:hypothetical protein